MPSKVDGTTVANRNRRVRQQALRDQLAAQGHHQHAVEILDKLRDLETTLDQTEIVRLGKAFDGHMKFLNKYLPDVKEVLNEHAGENGDPIEVIQRIEVIDFIRGDNED